jgi:hypothetical protein
MKTNLIPVIGLCANLLSAHVADGLAPLAVAVVAKLGAGLNFIWSPVSYFSFSL